MRLRTGNVFCVVFATVNVAVSTFPPASIPDKSEAENAATDKSKTRGPRGPRGDLSYLSEHEPTKEHQRRLEKSKMVKGDLGAIHLSNITTVHPIRIAKQEIVSSEAVVLPTTQPPFTQQHKFLENEHAAISCSPGEFISRLHLSYTSEPLRSTYFTYSFRFRRQPIVLPSYGSSNVVHNSCHGLKFCVGHRACLFQVTDRLCLHNPMPQRRKMLIIRVACELTSSFPADNARSPLLKQLAFTVVLVSERYHLGKPVIMETVRSDRDVFALSCPQQMSEEFHTRFTGHCGKAAPSQEQVTSDMWKLAGRAPSVLCQRELMDVYCAYKYNASGGCYPRSFLVAESSSRDTADPAARNKLTQTRQSSSMLFRSLPAERPRVTGDSLRSEDVSSSDLEPARIGFVILVLDHPVMALQLVQSLFDPLHYFVLHVDSRATTIRHLLMKSIMSDYIRKGYNNVHVLPLKRSVVTSPASFSIVQAQLLATEELLSMGHWDFAVVSLSKSDMSLRTAGDLAAMLAAYKGSNFLHVSRLWNKREHKSDLYAWHQCRQHDFVYNVTRRASPNLDIASHGQVAVISREAAEIVVKGVPRSLSDAARLQFTLETSLNPADVYIATVLMNSRLSATMHDTKVMIVKSASSAATTAVNVAATQWCAGLKEADICLPEASTFTAMDVPYLRRMSLESMFAGHFEIDADDAVRGALSLWVNVDLAKHTKKMYQSDTTARIMATMLMKELLGEDWRAEANLSRISSMSALPKLKAGLPCCREDSFVVQTGLVNQVLYLVEFTVVLKGSSRRKRVRGSVAQLPRAQCFPDGHVKTMMFGTRFIFNDGRHSPWTSLIPAAWDPAGDTSFWVLIVLNTKLPSATRSCSLSDFLLGQDTWSRTFPHLSDEIFYPNETSTWSMFSTTNHTMEFVVHLVDPNGMTRCQKPFTVNWHKSEGTSWQSWRVFRCGILEPGLWTARLVPVAVDGDIEQQPAMYESHIFLASPTANIAPTTLSSMSALWNVERVSFVNSRTTQSRPKISVAPAILEKNLRRFVMPAPGLGNDGKGKFRGKSLVRRKHGRKSRPPGSKGLTVFETWFNSLAFFCVRFLVVVLVLYIVLTKVFRVRIRGGRYSVMQVIVLMAILLVIIQTALHSKLP
ncbi:uncharacterized protein LOC135806112 [Sycon ciliatum]|uniref:uncharacterized protein LOC135806112 n=1 Tax=Sycon ciliatum TaxID=27933 RepID=UPI0031F68AF0